jgi:hypothetical protein
MLQQDKEISIAQVNVVIDAGWIGQCAVPLVSSINIARLSVSFQEEIPRWREDGRRRHGY